MYNKLLVLLALVSVVRNHDVLIGSDGGRKIFEDTRFASPAIWRQLENVTVIAPNNEVISKVNITDMRADKDGDVDIINGGEGEKSVTIEIKSPTVLRGYEFHIEVFAVPESNYKKSENGDKAEDMPEDILNNEYKTTTPPQNSDSESSESSSDIPTSIAKDSDILRPARRINDDDESETLITSTETLYKESTTNENEPSTTDTEENKDGTTESIEGSGNDENSEIVIPSDWLRPARGVDSENNLTEIPVENESAITTTETSNEDNTTIDNIPDDDTYNQETTTELLEVVPIDPAVRPARETNDNESTVTITKTLNTETTEGTLNDDDNKMGAPNTYVSTKDMQDYSALSILDYIKNREHADRKARRFEMLYHDYTQSPNENQNNENEDSSSPEDFISRNDDTVDLVPPEIDAPYNDNFSPDLGTTEEPIESTTTDVTSDASDDDSTPPMSEDATTESSLEEKSRNSRNTEDNLENSNNFDLTSETEPSEDPSSNPVNNKISTGIVLLKEDRVIITAGGKQVEFALPIVLIIGNENNFPMFKLVEDSMDIEKKDSDEAQTTLNVSPDIIMDYEDKDAASDVAKNEEYSY